MSCDRVTLVLFVDYARRTEAAYLVRRADRVTFYFWSTTPVEAVGTYLVRRVVIV